MKILFFTSMLFLCSCVNGNSIKYEIEMADAKRLIINYGELNPEYKGSDIFRDEIEVSIISKINFFNESKNRAMTLRSYTGYCDDFEHIPSLASTDIYYDGKSSSSSMYEGDINPNEQGWYIYKIYLSVNKINEIKLKGELNLCTEFGGDTYLVGYKSNRIKLELSQIKL